MGRAEGSPVAESASATTPSDLVVSASSGVFPQFNLNNPGLGTLFGASVVPLSSGNIVVTEIGAAYLFNGQTGPD